MKKIKVAYPLLVVFALAAGVFLGSRWPGINILRHGGSDKLDRILSIIHEDYVDEIDTDSLLEQAIPDLLAKLDPHTAYIPADDLEEVNNELEGSFSGIGISFQLMQDTITVLEVISGGPSERVGLKAGDRIVTVNDSTVAGVKIKQDAVLKLLRGPKDTKVKLGISRGGSPEMFSYTVTRGDIPVNSIDASYIVSPTIGYIKVNKFGRNTYQEFFTQMMMLRRDGARKYIVDLRGNSGGYLDQAILMTNLFLPAGSEIVSTRGRNGFDGRPAIADGTGTFQTDSLVVLMDEFSASASEIMAGAVQDNDRATIIGRRSFGKGLVQTQRDLGDGSALRITTARYYTPSGRCIQKPFVKGEVDNYQLEVYDRYRSGEVFSADSVRPDTTLLYHTRGGRQVYGGGGIMPDVFVPTDTADMTGYLRQVVNSGLLNRFAFEYVDVNRSRLAEATTVNDILALLPSDALLLQDFVTYAAKSGVAARWYYINISRNLIVNQLKALIARDALGVAAYYEIANMRDKMVERAIEELSNLPSDDGQTGNTPKNQKPQAAAHRP